MPALAIATPATISLLPRPADGEVPAIGAPA
ncbi:hypothetical protein MPHL43072_14505 [Mycolicibacterium phlei DSM 43072]|nr:hypothetical protein MPHL43072_14505 [Mycolicibacterium phlei DSM 43072]